MRPGRKKAVKQGIVRTISFVMAGLLSLMLYWFGGDGWVWARDPVILLIFAFLILTVFFAMQSRIPYRVDDVIHDILRSTGYTLGGPYRLNIMVLEGEQAHQYFRITHSFRMNDPMRYRKRLEGTIEGAGTAFLDNATTYITGKQIDNTVDPYPVHIWSTPIRNRHGDPRAVLNADCNTTVIEKARIAEVSNAVELIARLVDAYWELRDE